MWPRIKVDEDDKCRNVEYRSGGKFGRKHNNLPFWGFIDLEDLEVICYNNAQLI